MKVSSILLSFYLLITLVGCGALDESQTSEDITAEDAYARLYTAALEAESLSDQDMEYIREMIKINIPGDFPQLSDFNSSSSPKIDLQGMIDFYSDRAIYSLSSGLKLRAPDSFARVTANTMAIRTIIENQFGNLIGENSSKTHILKTSDVDEAIQNIKNAIKELDSSSNLSSASFNGVFRGEKAAISSDISIKSPRAEIEPKKVDSENGDVGKLASQVVLGFDAPYFRVFASGSGGDINGRFAPSFKFPNDEKKTIPELSEDKLKSMMDRNRELLSKLSKKTLALNNSSLNDSELNNKVGESLKFLVKGFFKTMERKLLDIEYDDQTVLKFSNIMESVQKKHNDSVSSGNQISESLSSKVSEAATARKENSSSCMWTIQSDETSNGKWLIVRVNCDKNTIVEKHGSYSSLSFTNIDLGSLAGNFTKNVIATEEEDGNTIYYYNLTNGSSVDTSTIMKEMQARLPDNIFVDSNPPSDNSHIYSVSSFSLGGSVTGLTGTVTLRNGSETLDVTDTDSFAFTSDFYAGDTYDISVETQPSQDLNCVVENAAGSFTVANIKSPKVNCTSTLRTIGGTVSGLASSMDLTLDTPSETIQLSSNSAFQFSGKVRLGENYQVTISSQPAGQTCVVNNGSGTVSDNISNISIVCGEVMFELSGTVSGLGGGETITLRNNINFDQVVVSANGSYSFNSVSGGDDYDIRIVAKPSGKVCAYTGSFVGTANSDVTDIDISCASGYTIGGTVSGLSGMAMPGLGLTLTVLGVSFEVADNGAFTFPDSFLSGDSYNVTIDQEPMGQSCSITGGASSGTLSGNVSDITIECSDL